MDNPHLSVPALRAFLLSKGEVIDGVEGHTKRWLLNTLLISAHDGHDKVFDLAAIKRETEMINEAIAFAVTFKRGPKGRLASARSLGLLPPTDGS